VKTAASSNYFTVFLLLYVTTNIYTFQTTVFYKKFDAFTPCNAEHHMQKEFLGIPYEKKVIETEHRFCVMIFQNAIRFSRFSSQFTDI